MSAVKAERYAAYKDSGVEWLGNVPAHWEIKHLKALAEIKGGKDSFNVDVEEGGYPVYGSGGIFGRASAYLHNKPSVLLGRKGTVDKPLFVAEPFWSVDTMFYTYIKRNVEPKFFYYKCLTIQFGLYQYGSAVPSMASNVLSRILFAVPPLSEQTAIAAYLDTKTAQIDRQIELLSQKATQYSKLKQSLINLTVTRGLDKSVPLKDSGVEWLGMVPDHWEVKRVKEVGLVVLGKMLDNVKSENTRLRSYLKSKNIGWLKVEDTDIEQMYFSAADMKSYRLKRGDILLSEGGEVGKTAFWNDEIEECYIQNSVHKITVYKNNCARFFLYQSFLLGSIKYYDSIVSHVSIKHLTKEKLSRVSWVRPPVVEQVAIAAYLDDKTAQIVRIVKAINDQIDKLKDLRKALINDVVTGKIKVVSEGQAA